MTKRYKKQNMGSVSHGTMRPEDLIPDFIWELRSQTPTKREHRKLIREIESNIGRYDGEKSQDSVDFYYQSDEAAEHLDELFNALNEYAPPYFYFGAHPGDGADYGFWLSEMFGQDEFDGVVESSNGFKTTFTLDGQEIDGIPKGYTGELLQVNDHGNMTLYRVTNGRKREIWSVV